MPPPINVMWLLFAECSANCLSCTNPFHCDKCIDTYYIQRGLVTSPCMSKCTQYHLSFQVLYHYLLTVYGGGICHITFTSELVLPLHEIKCVETFSKHFLMWSALLLSECPGGNNCLACADSTKCDKCVSTMYWDGSDCSGQL